MVDAFELDGLHWMHHLQGCLVEGPPWFGDLEISPISFGNYL